MRIVIITDAWHPQINGVVRTLSSTAKELTKWGHEVTVIEPSMFDCFPNPFYKEIPIPYRIWNHRKYIKPPCAVHISTESTLGLSFNWYCRNNNIPFTSSYHTNFPDYLQKYLFVPQALSYAYMKWFHRPSRAIMVSSPTLEAKMHAKGFSNIKRWSRGVDVELFKPITKTARTRPICTYVGRVAKEKNIDAFMTARVNADKVVVGNGPCLPRLKKQFRDVKFLGALHGEELAQAYANSDCLVFPSKTDTFGLVLIEALACGVPIAGYPVEGPIDIWDKDPATGCLNDDLEYAIDTAIKFVRPERCRELAMKYSWKNCTRQFFNTLVNYNK